MAKRKKIDEFLASLKSQAENEASFEKAYRAFADCMPFSDDVDLGANKNSPHAIEGWLVCKLGIEVVYRLKKISLGVTHVTECMVKDVISNLGLAGDDFLMITKALNILSSLSEEKCRSNCITILSAPTKVCEKCKKNLVVNHQTHVNVFTLAGYVPGLKITSRCVPCGLTYNYDRFGSVEGGWGLYEHKRPFVEATDTCFVSRDMLEFQCCLANHSWVSFLGFSSTYNDTFDLNGKEFTEKHAASAFWNGEVESEARDLGQLNFFGLLHKNDDREQVMERMDEIRAETNYKHPPEECYDSCKKRGCGKLWVADGQWKLGFAHCMMSCKNTIKGLPLLNYPNVCVLSPMHGKAFCAEHTRYMETMHPNIPTGLRDFLKYCNVQSVTDVPNEEVGDVVVEENEIAKVDKVIKQVEDANLGRVGKSAIESQGHTEFINNEHEKVNILLKECEETQTATTCNKDTGKKQRLQKWSRGHLFVVRGGGIIDKWNPIYTSESPSQVFLLVLQWLFIILKNIPPSNWKDVFLAYDNMCHLDGMKICQSELPWPEPWNKCWQSINKIIDCLHLKNHKDPKCAIEYNPDKLKQVIPEGNTMAAEQTFVWLSRYKKILCCMPRVHHLFYLHRMVKRRNNYTTKCYRLNKKPVLPKGRK